MPSYNPNRIKSADRAARTKGGNYKLGSHTTLTKREQALVAGIEQIIQIFHGESEPCDCDAALHKFHMNRKYYVKCTACRRLWHDQPRPHNPD